MAEQLDPRLLKEAICALTEVEQTQQGCEVTLPQVYHTGQAVNVIVAQTTDGFVVHDNSYAAMLLSAQGLSPGKKLAAALAPQIDAYGCELEDLRVRRHCRTIAELGFAMSLVGCASRLIADQALKADHPPLRDFKSSLISRVIETVGTKRVRTNEEVNGHLGSRYKVSVIVLDALQDRPVAFVEPIADREAIARRFKQFYDLARTPEFGQVQRVAVYDQLQSISSGDALLMEEVGNLVRFEDTTVRFREWATIQ